MHKYFLDRNPYHLKGEGVCRKESILTKCYHDRNQAIRVHAIKGAEGFIFFAYFFFCDTKFIG